MIDREGLEKLAPCPNPGCPAKGDARSLEYSTYDECVECGSCGMQGPSMDTREEAVAAWNALPRALLAAGTERVEEETADFAWNEVLDAFRRVWPGDDLIYSESPVELIYRLRDERDAARSAGTEGWKDRANRAEIKQVEDAAKGPPAGAEVGGLDNETKAECQQCGRFSVVRWQGGGIPGCCPFCGFDDASSASAASTEGLYTELLYEVANKVEGETRHETARRIIHEHENRPIGMASDAALRGEEP